MLLLILKILLGVYLLVGMLCVCVTMVQIDKLLNDLINLHPDDFNRTFFGDLKFSLICFIVCFVPFFNLLFCFVITFDKEGIKEALTNKLKERKSGTLY